MIKIALVNQKGGVSKTTSAVNISSNLVELGYKVLAVDLDPQGNLGYNFGFDTDNLKTTIYDVLTKNLSVDNAIYKTDFKVDVLPSSLLLANAELEISSKMNRESILKNAFKKSNLNYDFCIMDLPPNLGLLTLNGLTLADYIIIPQDCSVFSLSGINQLIGVIQLIKENELNPNLEVLGVVLAMVDSRTNISKEMYQTLEEIFEDKVFKTQIHQNVKVPESQKAQQPLNFFAKDNRGNLEYKELTQELIKRVRYKE